MNISQTRQLFRPQATASNQPASQAQTNQQTREATFSYNPQDELVMAPGTEVIPGVRADGSTEKFVTSEKLPTTDGNYVYDSKDQHYHEANAFAAANRTFNIFQKAYGEPIHWSRANRLEVHGDEGRDLNAYYDGQGLHFFDYPIEGKNVYSGDSGEVVGHETGHALLDAVRPSYLGSWATEPGAFHESFGDVVAMLAGLKDERTLDLVAKQTGGDMRKQNAVAALGEQLGVAINKVSGGNATGGPYTRNAINSFTYKDPKSLPRSGGPDELHSEVHDFSRLWTGAFYDIFTGMVDSNMNAGMDAKTAISTAADDGLKMYANLFKPGYAPDGDFKYKDMAAAMIKSENEQNGGKYTGLIKKVMSDRQILPAGTELAATEPSTLPSGTHKVTTTLDGDRFGQFAGAKVETAASGDMTSFAGNGAEAADLQNDLARQIDAGNIKMTEPNQVVTQKDLFKADGTPYTGVVRWVDGQMSIERVLIAS